MASPRSFLRELTPRGLPIALVLAALGVGALGLLVALAMAISPGGIGDRFSGGSVLMGFIALPVMAVLFGIAGLIDRRALSRAMYFWLGTVTMTLAGIFLGSGMLASLTYNDGKPLAEALGTSIFSGTCCGLVPTLVFVIPALLFTVRGLRELRSGTTTYALERVRDLLVNRGALSFQDLSREAEVAPDHMVILLQTVMQRERFSLRIEPDLAWVCTSSHIQQSLEKLPAIVTTRGRIELAELATELRAPESVVKEWIYRAVQSGKLHGYINWRDGVLYSREAEALRNARSCPNCGGPMELVGRGVVKCHACDAEILV